MDTSSLGGILISLLTLALLEIVLGVDNLIFIAILSARLPLHKQKSARRMGLLFALVTRLLLLASVVWLVGLTKPLFQLFGHGFSGRDIFLITGGVFLLAKGTREIHAEFEASEISEVKHTFNKFFLVIIQIAIFDIIFSLDSILTAIGLTHNFWIMATAITLAIITMIFAQEPLSKFIYEHPTVKMLALSFLLLIGMVLVADGVGVHFPRGYIYFAVCFSVLVEMLNIFLARKKRKRMESTSNNP